MSTTTKTVLIVAGAGVGVFVLLKLLSPSPISAYGKQPANTGILSVNGILGLGAGLVGLFKGSSSSSSSSGGAYSDPASQRALAAFDKNNYTVEDGFMFTDSSGNFIAG